MPPNRSGQRCRVVDGRTHYNEGEGKSPNLGKIVTTVEKLEGKAGDYATVWHCVSDEDIIGYYGTVGKEGNFLAEWLEVLPPELPKTKAMEKEHEHT